MIFPASQWTRPTVSTDETVIETTRRILADIASRGDEAISEYSRKFDGFKPQPIELKPFAEYAIAPELAEHMQIAAQRIRRFAEFQMAGYQNASFTDEFGEYGQVVQPVEAMAAYIPGGRFPLLSTAMMTLIPAQVAGCRTRLAVSPTVNEVVLAAASLSGATAFLRMGGAQAIAALAYGCQLTPAVDMVVGPGNAYVNAAKGLLQDRVRIDTLAGPSELLILSDGNTPLDWLLYDMLAQSEHDPRAVSVLVSRSQTELEAMLAQLEATDEGRDQLTRGQIQLVFAETVDEAIAACNLMAPEHLLLCDEAISPERLLHYGSLFVGKYSAVALGDYCSGPNHTLPTNAFARKKAGLYVGDFLRVQSYQKITEANFERLARTGMALAEAEGLTNHWKSLEVRL